MANTAIQSGITDFNSRFTVKVKRTGRVQPANLDNGPLTEIGRLMVKAQLQRWSQGVNAEGNKAKPLSKRYLFIKQAYTKVHRPIRDMKMTGRTVANFQLRKAVNGTIRAENTTRAERTKAQRAQGYEEMIGFAGSDQMTVFRASQIQYGNWLQKAWIPIG